MSGAGTREVTPAPALSLSLWPPKSLLRAEQIEDTEKVKFCVCVEGKGVGDIHLSIQCRLLSGPSLLPVLQARDMD